MIEWMWHLKMCQLCPWTTLEKKQTEPTQTVPSSWLQSLVTVLLQIFVCSVIFSCLSSSDLSWGIFPSPVPVMGTAVLGHMMCHRDPDPNPNWGFLVWTWGGNTSLSYSPCIWSQKSEGSTFSISWPKHSARLCILLLPSKYLLI